MAMKDDVVRVVRPVLAVDNDSPGDAGLAVAADAVVRQPHGPLSKELADGEVGGSLGLDVDDAALVVSVERRDHSRRGVDADQGSNRRGRTVDENVEMGVDVEFEALARQRGEA